MNNIAYFHATNSYMKLVVILCLGLLPVRSWTAFPINNSCCEYSIFDGNLTIGAEWLYWKTTEDSLTIGTILDFSKAQNTPDVINAAFASPKLNFRTGIRLNMAYEVPCDGWDIDLCYTYIPGKANIRTFSTSDPINLQFEPNTLDFPFFATFGRSFQYVPPSVVNACWTLHINNLDIDLGKTVHLLTCLKIRPHIGFRALWLDQHYRYKAEAAIAESSTTQHQNLQMKEKTPRLWDRRGPLDRLAYRLWHFRHRSHGWIYHLRKVHYRQLGYRYQYWNKYPPSSF